MVMCCFSQKISYPQKIVQGSDTLVLITTGQVKKINKTYNDLREYKELSDSLRSIIVSYQGEVQLLVDLNKALTGKLYIKEEIIKKQAQVMVMYEDEITRQRKVHRKDMFWQKSFLVTLGGIVVLLIIVGG